MNIARTEDLNELIGILISHIVSTESGIIDKMGLIKQLGQLRDKINNE